MLLEHNLIFFNHYHRGDLFTHKEFARQCKKEITWAKMAYWHYNHPKVNADLGIPLQNTPYQLDNKQLFYYLEQDNKIFLLVNTWIGCHNEIFAKHGGVNLLSLTESWKVLFDEINSKMKSNLVVDSNIEAYLPTIDWDFFNVDNVDDFVAANSGKKVLFCNGVPMSNQSFASDLSKEIKDLAHTYKDILFICTKKFDTSAENIKFTDDIIQDTEEFQIKTPWNDRPLNNCDLNEISYLSTKCNAIIGKNSGPFVFCETKENFMDPSKMIVSFSKGQFESMSNSVNMKCKYKLVTDHSEDNIKKVITQVVDEL